VAGEEEGLGQAALPGFPEPPGPHSPEAAEGFHSPEVAVGFLPAPPSPPPAAGAGDTVPQQQVMPTACIAHQSSCAVAASGCFVPSRSFSGTCTAHC
jgi:hypothetical protein